MSTAQRSFDQIAPGDSLGPEEIFPTREQTRTFARTCGLEAPRFMDDEGARAEGLPGMILPGNMSLGLLTRLVTDWIGTGGARVLRISTTYRSPVLPDCHYTLHGFVTQTDPTTRTAEFDLWLENEDGERMVTATATAQFP